MYRDINEVFREAFGYTVSFPIDCVSTIVPEGLELVETESHKKERLEKEITSKKQSLSYLQKHLTELSAEIAEEEKALLELSQHTE